MSLPDIAHHLHRRPTTDKLGDRVVRPAIEYFWLYGPPGSITTISMRDILSGELSDGAHAEAKTSAVFVGASDAQMTNFLDSFPPFIRGESEAWLSGVELAATAFLNLHAGERLLRPPPLVSSAVVILFAFALGFLVRLRGGSALFVAPVAALSYFAIAAFAFSGARIFLPVATPLFVVAPTAFILTVVFRYRFARALLMRVAPAPVARRIPDFPYGSIN